MRPAEQKKDSWHIYDIAFYTRTLIDVGVRSEDIIFLIDYPDPLILKEAFSTFQLTVPSAIRPVSDYHNILSTNTYDNVAIFITGHGGIDGFDTKISLKPFDFYEAIKKAPLLKQAVVYFGQCDAGIYNYISLDTSGYEYNKSKIVAIGAAGLHSSLSSSKITNLWAANVFLGYIFHWISNPIDVEGDNKYTVMDSYKYATIRTSSICKEIENEELLRSANYKTQLAYLYEKLKEKKTPTEDELLQMKALKEKLDSSISFDQIPWILNALPALDLEIK